MGHIASAEPDVRRTTLRRPKHARSIETAGKKENETSTCYALQDASRKGFEKHDVLEKRARKTEKEAETWCNTYMHVECIRKHKHEKLTAL
jgi:hypothetical protein